MHAAAWRALRAAHQLHPRTACRIVAGVRHRPARCFHSSTVALRAPEEPAGAAASEKKDDSDKPEDSNSQSGSNSEVTEGAEDPIQSNDVSKRSARRQGYGSGVRRASRHKSTTGLPPLAFPEWFWKKNVTCFGEPEDLARWVEIENPEKGAYMASNDLSNGSPHGRRHRRILYRIIEQEIHDTESWLRELESLLKYGLELRGKAQQLGTMLEKEYPYADQPYEISWSKTRLGRSILWRRHPDLVDRLSIVLKLSPGLSKSPSWYSIHHNIYTEIYASFSGELRLPPPKINIKDANRQDMVLVCPVDGGLKYLDAVVQSVATVLEADIIRLDAENIAQIVGEYLGEDIAWRQSPTAMLGYGDSNRADLFGSQNLDNDYEDAKYSDESDDNHPTKGNSSPFHPSVAFLHSSSKIFQVQNLSKVLNLGSFLGQSADSGAFTAQAANPGENWNDYKTSRAMDAIIGAADFKRAQSIVDEVGDQQWPKASTLPASKGLIIQISGYDKLNDHPVGHNLLKSLREAVKRRWYAGKSVMIVGTLAVNAGEKSEQVSNIIADRFASEITIDRPRTIFVPPGGRYSERIPSDRIAEIRDLNIRHIEHMIRKLMSLEPESQWTIKINRDMPVIARSELGSGVWGYDWVRRVAINMLGIAGSDRVIDGSTLYFALRMSRLSDKSKLSWAKQDVYEVKQESSSNADDRGIINAGHASKIYPTLEESAKKKQDWLDKLKVKCTSYEKKLLGGVINPSDIHTTFADVRTTSETVEALKTLTSLSLIRPDSFSYGVLKSDRIPGVLLYGPPGTGKTLLAKAVAKESGAIMLEVSASEINDMYVGEGEKNVKALFSLAKKLTPCVVFIDEADSLFGSRGTSSQRKSHREIINQFLREWDGMANHSAFIMVATNRPFDLDEAVLRRLPRRLLVDLPMEKDREAILQIHLRNEILDDSISLPTLAKNTPFYSGSDLKNLSVAAALACVREENETAAKYTGEEPYVYPPRRILRKEHFDRAMQEISASISEDMSTLREIRKFDESYGDRKGRRKKKAGIGFGGTADPEPDADAGRVRKLELNV